MGYGIKASYADLCTAHDDESILKSAYLFWFKGEDWLGYTKIFDYFTLKIKKGDDKMNIRMNKARLHSARGLLKSKWANSNKGIFSLILMLFDTLFH